MWFVGAGPGDRELITLKGYRLLQQAQVVIYAGSLINTELLAYCPPQAECHDSAALHLEQILDLMEAGVKAGKTVVRLQTGDVSLYGSVREQGEELTRRGIRWQVVPGVSAFLGAAAELGVEYTVPEVSQSLIITRLEGRTPVPAREQLEAFCQPSNLDGDLPVGATYSPGGGAAGGGRLPRDHPGRGDLQGHLAGKPDRPRYPRGHRRQSTRRRDPQNGADPGRPLPRR